MSKLMLIDAVHPEETRVAIVNDGQVDDFDFETTGSEQLRGNIYLAKVTRVEPSLQAAFVEYGGNRHGFLAFSEIHPDYYQLPAEDREALLREAAEAVNEDDDDDEDDDSETDEDLGDTDESDETEASDDTDDETESDDEDDEDEDDADEASDAEASAEDESDDESDDEDDTEDDGERKPKAKAQRGRRPANKTKRVNLSKRYKIQEVIRRRQVMLVQVAKEERGNKGAALTTYLSLAGRYSVLMPNTPRGGGISRKIVNGADRKRLKSVVAELDVPEGQGLIVRTAGAKRTKAEIKRDYEYLSKLWENIVEKTLTSEAPALINAEGGLVHRAMRDMFDKDIEEVLVQGDGAYREAKDLAKLIMPSQTKKVQQWKDEDPLFVSERVEEQLDSIYSPTVQLKSGGYLVINQTEALVAIDVNSGKATKERNIEATALRTNIEAAEEACRQMRLRDLAGLVVIDFIDMDENKNNRAVEKKLKECLKVDRARVQHGRISQFGLMEISRQRRRQGVLQATSDPCGSCNGTGRRRSIPSAALQLIRAIEARASMGGLKSLSVKAPTEVALYLLNNKRDALTEIENMAGFAISIHSSEEMLPGDFTLDAERDPNSKPKKRKPPRSLAKPTPKVVAEDDEDDDETDAEADASDENDEEPTGRKRRRRRRGGRGRNREKQTVETDTDTSDDTQGAGESDETEATETADEAEVDGDNEDGAPRKRRRRGRRGGRRRRRGNNTQPSADLPEDGGAYLDGLSVSSVVMLEDDVPSKPYSESAGDAAPSQDEATAVGSESEKEASPEAEKPKRRRRSRGAKSEDSQSAANDSGDEQVSPSPASNETDESAAPETLAEPAEEIVEATEETAAETPTPDPAQVDTPDTVAEETAAPKKKGWWNRGR